jgi:hypothetical protein
MPSCLVVSCLVLCVYTHICYALFHTHTGLLLLASNCVPISHSPTPPFTCIRNLQISIDKIIVKHEKFQDMVFNVNTATNVDFKELRKGLVKDVRASDRQVKELKTRAVDMTERNRDKFQHISDHELGQRKKFVDELQRSINGEWEGYACNCYAAAIGFIYHL